MTRGVVIAAAGLVVWSATVRGAEDSRPSPEVLATQVRSIFAVECVSCHGADLPKPKGKFGYVLDLGRIAVNKKWVIPGNATDSELYQMLLHNEMPGKNATERPLTKAEVEIVRQWIMAGAPAAPASAAVVASHAEPVKPLPLRMRLLRDLGQFHPLSTHFPVGLLIVALPAELFWLRTRKHSWKAAVRFCVGFGALGAVLAAALGWCNAEFTSYATPASMAVLSFHRWFGTATAVWAVLIAVLSELSNREGDPRHLRYGFRVSLAIGAGLVSLVGFLGGSLIYGLNHYVF